MAGHGPQLNAWSCQVVLVASKVLRVLAIGNAAELLRGVMSLRLFVFVTYAVAGISFALTHRPWRSRRPLARWRLVRVGAHAVALVGSFALWSLGLQRVGVLHTVLFDHAELWTVCAVALCTRPGPMREQRAKGTALVGLGYALLAAGAFVWPWQPQQQSATGAPTSGAAFGIAALLLSALVNVARAHSVRKLVSEVGGHKRLHALGTCAGAVLWPALCLLPPPWPSVGLDSDGGGGGGGSRQLGASSLLGACAGALVMVVGSYYADALAHTRMPPAQPERNSLYTSVTAALALDALGECRAWRSPCALGATALVLSGAHTLLRGEVPAAELGPLSGVLSAASGGGSIRLPLHARVSTAAGVDLATLSAQLRQLWARRTTRRLLVYLCINFAFTLVEASLGRSSHSLSLVSDACHMLLDCAALAIGLFGEVASRWQPSGEHTFGYARFEVVCALANAALLLLTALALAREACARVLLRAPAVDSSRLLPVAVTGLGVNLLGIFFFSEHHVHLTAADACGVCTTAGDAARAHSANMAAVLLHVAADALGSIGVIISSLLIRTLGWTLVDPLCSMLISALIFASAWPLFAQSAAVLMQRTPYMLEGPRLDACLSAVRAVDGVEAVADHAFWMLTLSHNVGTVTVRACDGVRSGEHIVAGVKAAVKRFGIDALTVQVNFADERGGAAGEGAMEGAAVCAGLQHVSLGESGVAPKTPARQRATPIGAGGPPSAGGVAASCTTGGRPQRSPAVLDASDRVSNASNGPAARTARDSGAVADLATLPSSSPKDQ